MAHIKPLRRAAAYGLVAVVAIGVMLRLDGLGERSLWLDEFSTWHVSRLPLGESLVWPAERSVAPLYQLSLRAVTSDPQPPEWLLRLPAAVAGCASLAAAAWLGWTVGGPALGLMLAAALALQPLQIDYSREARGYSMLVLAGLAATTLWLRLLAAERLRPTDWVGYVAAGALGVYAHYLMVFTLVAHTLTLPLARRRWVVGSALAAAALLCAPLALRVLAGRAEIGEALAWVPPLSLGGAMAHLASVGFGSIWLAAAALCAALALVRRQALQRDGQIAVAVCVAWLAATWVVPAALAMCGLPLGVERYFLHAGAPLVLSALLAARMAQRHAPAALTLAALALVAPAALRRSTQAPAPGFRELTWYLNDSLAATPAPVWFATANPAGVLAEMELLGWRYYEPQFAWRALHLNERVDATGTAAAWVVVFLREVDADLTAAGGGKADVVFEELRLPELYFRPYRLQYWEFGVVAPDR